MSLVSRLTNSLRGNGPPGDKKQRPTVVFETTEEANSPTSPIASPSTAALPLPKTGLKKSSSLRKSNPTPAFPRSETPQVFLPMPSELEVKRQLEELMTTLGFEETQKNSIRTLPLDSQWKMIQSNNQIANIEKKKIDAGDDTATPEFLVVRMRMKNIPPSFLKSIWISLKTQRIAWVISFIELGGLIEMLQLIDEISKKPIKKPSDLEGLKFVMLGMKALLNNKHGIKAVLNHDGALDIIALGLDTQNLAEKSLVMELLVLMCYVDKPNGHKKVLRAMDHYRDFKKEDARFRTLVNNIGANCFKVEERDVIDFLVTSMLLVNAIINEAEDLSLRIHLRNEFFALEFAHIFDKLRKVKTNYTQKQVEIFETEMNEDYDELLEFYDQSRCDMQDPNSIFQRLYQSVVGTSSFKPFLTIFQLFLLIRNQPEARKNYWILINQVFTSVVLDGKGYEPDFRTKYGVSVERLIEGLMEKEKYRQLLDESKENKAKVESSIRDKEKLSIEWKENFDQMKTKYDALIQKLTAAVAALGQKGGEIHTAAIVSASALGPEDVKALSTILNEENNNMKKIALDLKNSKDLGAALKTIETAQIFLEKKDKGPPAAPGGGAPPPPPAPGGGGAPRPPPPPPGMGGGPPPPPPPPPGMGGPPPPPPPPGMGGPPPPPPPPGMGGPPPPPPPGGFGPPPPPGFGPPAQPPVPKFIAQTKMKQFHWDKIPQTALQNTIWEKTKIDENFYKKTLDLKEFEELFGAKEGTPLKDAGKKVEKKPDLITVVDPKKAYNCSLMLGLLKMSNTEIKKAILTVDKENLLSDNTCVQLINYIPSTEEIASLKPFKEDPSKLAAADQFMLVISEIPRLEQRINAMIYKRSFNEKLAEIRPSIDSVTKASRALKSCKSFHKVLEIILILGNYMNGTGRSGGAIGFKLASINKLADTKSANNKMNLLNFIAVTLENKFPEVMQFTEELADIEPASKVSFTTLTADMNELRVGLKKIDTELEQFKKASPDDNFDIIFKPFVDEGKTEFEELDKKFKRMDEAYQAVLAFYGEDPKMAPEEFFSMVNRFLELYKQAVKENSERAEIQAKELKKQQAAEEREERKKQRGIRSIGLDNIEASGDEEKAVLDDMLQSLKNGDAYSQKEKGGKKTRRKQDDDDDGGAAALLKQLQQN